MLHASPDRGSRRCRGIRAVHGLPCRLPSAHGFETGVIRQSPDGGYTDERRPASAAAAAALAASKKAPRLPAAGVGGIPPPRAAGVPGGLRTRASAVFAETAAGNGQVGGGRAAVPGASPRPGAPGSGAGGG